MKRVLCAAVLALSLLSFSSPPQSDAQEGQSAEGRFWFTTEDRVTRYFEFSAIGDGEGGGKGVMTFNDTSKVPDDDSGGDPPPRPPDSPSEFYAKAEFDGLIVEKNRAIMSGVVVESSHKSYVGRWIQLVVEDNAENIRLPDRLTWRFCRPEPGGWVPSDYERPGDNGAYLSWWATDFERRDDVGIPSQNLIPGSTKGCRSYALSAYDFVNPYKWEGDIVVRP
jgi:hypothetical protein